MCQIVKSDFCMKVKIEGKDFVGKWWVILVYISTDDNIKESMGGFETQKKELGGRSGSWGEISMIL